MQARSLFARMMDRIVVGILLWLVLAVAFTSMLRNALWGAVLALPVDTLLFYALRLWSRRREGKWAKAQAARYHLHEWMLSKPEQALSTAREWLSYLEVEEASVRGDRIRGHYAGQPVEAVILQRPLEVQIAANDVLQAYLICHEGCLLIVSNAEFSESAILFARQCSRPQVALIGPEQLAPHLQDIPVPQSAVDKDGKKRRAVHLSRLLEHITDPSRQWRCLLYGAVMLIVYIVFDAWVFLIPGLVSIFLAVIAHRQHRKPKGLL